MYTYAPANQAIHPFFRVGKLVLVICRRNSALCIVGGGDVGSWLLVRTSVSQFDQNGPDKIKEPSPTINISHCEGGFEV